MTFVVRSALSMSLGLALMPLGGCGKDQLLSNTGTNGNESESTSTDPPSESSTQSGTETETGSETAPSSSMTDFTPDTPADPVPCDPWEQDCAEGEKCVPWASQGQNWDAYKCVPLLGDQAPGEPCVWDGIVEATDTCDATSICWDTVEVEGEQVGLCVPQCTGSPDEPMCDPGSQCSISGDGSLILCLPDCDPLVQDCAQEDDACYWTGSDFNCAPTNQNIPVGETCGFVNDCAAGLMCVSAESLPDCLGVSCCTTFCELSLGDAACEAAFPGTMCVPFWDENPPADFEDLGVCVIF